MHYLRPGKESLKPSPSMKGLPDMCEKLAKTCVLNYLGGLWLSQQPFAISWDPVKQKWSFVRSTSAVERGTYSERICVLGPALEDAKLFQLMALNSMRCLLLNLNVLKRLYQRKRKVQTIPSSAELDLTLGHLILLYNQPSISHNILWAAYRSCVLLKQFHMKCYGVSQKRAVELRQFGFLCIFSP